MDYKKKYFKYKIKYNKLKNLVGGNKFHLNFAIRAFRIEKCLDLLHKLFSSYDETYDRVSIGSGNGYFESLYNTQYSPPYEIICIDPLALSFNSSGLDRPYIIPKYQNVQEYMAKKDPKKQTLLFINWPDPALSYDIESIKLLKPAAFLIIFAKQNMVDALSPFAGSPELVDILTDTSASIDIYGQKFLRILLRKGRFFGSGGVDGLESNFRIALYLDTTKIDDRNPLMLSKDWPVDKIHFVFRNFEEARAMDI